MKTIHAEDTDSWIKMICDADFRTKVPELKDVLKNLSVGSAEQDYQNHMRGGQFY